MSLYNTLWIWPSAGEIYNGTNCEIWKWAPKIFSKNKKIPPNFFLWPIRRRYFHLRCNKQKYQVCLKRAPPTYHEQDCVIPTYHEQDCDRVIPVRGARPSHVWMYVLHPTHVTVPTFVYLYKVRRVSCVWSEIQSHWTPLICQILSFQQKVSNL